MLNKLLLVTLLHFSLLAVTSAQEVIVEPQERLGPKLILLLDCSPSMDSDIDSLLEWIQIITEQPVDELEIAIYFFTDRHTRYPAEGFIELPNPGEIENIKVQVRQINSVKSSRTLIQPVLRSAVQEENASIVLISDLNFADGTSRSFIGTLEYVPVISVLGIGIGPDWASRTPLAEGRRLAGAGRGGFFRVRTDDQ